MQPVIEGLINNGASAEAIAETLKYMGISSTGGTVIAGNAVPFVNVNPNSTNTSDTYTYDTDSNDDEAVKQKRKTR